MLLKKQAFPIKGISEHQLIFCGFGDPEPVCDEIPDEKMSSKSSDIQLKLDLDDYIYSEVIDNPPLNEEFVINEKGIIGYVKHFCKHCYSRNVVKWNYTTRDWINDDFEGTVKVQRYKCKKCGRTSQTEFKGQYEPYCNISEELKEKAIKTKELNWSSLRDISEYYYIFNNLKLSHETVRKSLIVIKNNYIRYDTPKLSGYFGYDAQWLKIEKTWYYRHVLFDLYHHIPIAELLTDEENIPIVYDFIKQNIEQKDRIAIVTDLKIGYEDVMKELGFKRHQLCVFHLKLNINKLIKTEIRKLKVKYTQKLTKIYENESSEFIENEVETLLKKDKKEIGYYQQLFYYLFKERTYFKALSYIKLLKMNINSFPEFFKEYLLKNFFPRYKKFLYYLEFPYNHRLDNTNNQTENYIGGTMPKSYKKKFRTKDGIINQIYHKGNGWIKNKKNQQT